MPNIVYSYLFLVLISLISKRKLILLSFASLVFFFSFRTEWIPDTTNYMEMYDKPETHQTSEYGYRLLGDMFGQVTGADFMVFYLTLVSAMLLIWFFGTRKILAKENYTILLLLLFSFNGYFYFGVTIRSAITSILVYAAFCFFLQGNQRYKWTIYFILVILASLIHKSAFFFLPLIFFANIKLKGFHLYLIYGLCVVFWFISGFDFAKGILSSLSQFEMFDKLDKYTTDSLANNNMFSLQNLAAFLTMFICVFQTKNIERDYRNIYLFFLKINLVGLLVMSLFWHVSTAYRFYNMFFFYNFIIVYLVAFHNNKIKYSLIKYSIVMVISIMYFVTLIYSNPFFLLY